jgi:phenylacetate-CoA ligase
MRRMEKITGRSDDMMIVRGVNVFPPRSRSHYLIELTREGRMDEVTVHVEARPDHNDAAERASTAALLCHHVKEIVGVTVRVAVADPGKLERSAGKARRVIDRRPKEA